MATYWENSCSFGLRYVSWYKYLIVSLVFSHLGFWSGNLFLIAPFPDLCLLVPFYYKFIEYMDTNSGIQELAYYSEMENSKNKSHAKISEFTVYLCYTFTCIKSSLPFNTKHTRGLKNLHQGRVSGKVFPAPWVVRKCK